MGTPPPIGHFNWHGFFSGSQYIDCTINNTELSCTGDMDSPRWVWEIRSGNPDKSKENLLQDNILQLEVNTTNRLLRFLNLSKINHSHSSDSLDPFLMKPTDGRYIYVLSQWLLAAHQTERNGGLSGILAYLMLKPHLLYRSLRE